MKNGSAPRALVTGATSGIGRGIALALAAEGYRLIVSGRRPESEVSELLHQLESPGGSAVYVRGDLSDRDTRRRLVEAAGGMNGLDLLVNNAGMMSAGRKDLLEIDEDDMSRLLEVNLVAPFALTRDLVPLLEHKEGRGYIINITSINSYTASVRRGDYCVGKAGLSMLTKLFAARLAEKNIAVFEIRPGIIRTPMTEPVIEQYESQAAEGLMPMRRLGTPEDIARAVLALAGGFFPYSTGQIIDVDGGFHIRRL